MRRLLREISQTSNRGGNKVAIVYEADRMNAAAANAFLKTLEEPPKGTTIFMLTTRPERPARHNQKPLHKPAGGLRRRTGLDDEQWRAWLDDFKNWQKSLMGGVGVKIPIADAMMRCYGCLRVSTKYSRA